MIQREIMDWVITERIPAGEGPKEMLLMLHGWTGDEHSMEIFARKMPERYWLVAPRGIYASPLGGYSWFAEQGQKMPWVDDFRLAIELLFDLLVPENFPLAVLDKISIVGFSQGAALGYALAFLFPARVQKVAGLAGFLPVGCEALSRNVPLKGTQIYVAHGTQDEQISIESARQAAKVLEAAGAMLTFCEEKAGHKLGRACLAGLIRFFEV